MTDSPNTPADGGLLAIDVGTSRAKFGWFAPAAACTTEDKPSHLPLAAPRLRLPDDTFACSHRGVSTAEFARHASGWLEQVTTRRPQVVLASVNASGMAAVTAALNEHKLAARVLVGTQLPIAIEIDEPARVGIDRLLNAVAVNRLREDHLPAIIVDLGTAVTVDLVSAESAFQGGAILPGLTLAAGALHSGTATLPQIDLADFTPPANGVGKSTTQAISAGLHWGVVGAVRELIERVATSCSDQPRLFFTGGDAAHFAKDLAERLAWPESPRVIPHLVLAGIAASCEDSN